MTQFVVRALAFGWVERSRNPTYNSVVANGMGNLEVIVINTQQSKVINSVGAGLATKRTCHQ
ncbi:hypothetical protein MC7420_3044 [Coleofasciculus chthonoplastes PCC 7420]|uniref:Uncharacterized protein n=1 Tax=Coleofasciculus chthonoplastes PCC 7420 TaxID=118168 RepID=B4VKM9_9CYAN|nr:hypothetical protein MC7420_3044 [Coleofasciculus chthonoplastes PCC 7420]